MGGGEPTLYGSYTNQRLICPMKLGGWGVFLLLEFEDVCSINLYNDTTAGINKTPWG